MDRRQRIQHNVDATPVTIIDPSGAYNTSRDRHYEAKRGDIWDSARAQGYRIQEPPNISKKNKEKATRFQDALHWIVDKKLFLDRADIIGGNVVTTRETEHRILQTLSIEQPLTTLQNHIAKMVDDFERKIKPREKCNFDSMREYILDSGIDNDITAIKAIKDTIEIAQKFCRLQKFLIEFDTRYSNNYRQAVDQKTVRANLVKALDHRLPPRERDGARGRIESDILELEDIQREVLRPCANDLKVRVSKAKDCFTNNEPKLREQKSRLPEEFKRAFKAVKTFAGTDFLSLPRHEIKSDDIRDRFEPGVREIERLLPKLLQRLESHWQLANPQSPRLEGLLETIDGCEQYRSEQQPADQGFPSEMFRLCHRSIISEVYTHIKALQLDHPIDSRAFIDSRGLNVRPETFVTQFQEQLGLQRTSVPPFDALIPLRHRTSGDIKRAAIWDGASAQEYHIEAPANLSAKNRERTTRFQGALHSIVGNESFLTDTIGGVGQREEPLIVFQNCIADMVDNFEQNLQTSQQGSMGRQADRRIENDITEIKEIAGTIEIAQKFRRLREFLIEFDNKYISAPHRLEAEQKNVQTNLIKALDHRLPPEARDEAQERIKGDILRLEDIQREVLRRYANDLKVRVSRAEDCFANNEPKLREQKSRLPEEFQRAFKAVKTFAGTDFLSLPRHEIKSDDIRDRFEPEVRKLERLVPKLLQRLESDWQLTNPQSPRLEGLLETINYYEKYRSEQQPADQGFPSEMFRLCHRSIISEVYTHIKALQLDHPIDSRAFIDSRGLNIRPETFVTQFQEQLGL